jgi:hypothetical protein
MLHLDWRKSNTPFSLWTFPANIGWFRKQFPQKNFWQFQHTFACPNSAAFECILVKL